MLMKVLSDNRNSNLINLDGDDLRKINKNKDYSNFLRIKNISTAISIVRFLCSKKFYMYSF